MDYYRVCDNILEKIGTLSALNGWGQSELALRSGVGQSTLSQFQSAIPVGSKCLSVRSLCKISDAFGITLAELVDADISSVDLVAKSRKIVETDAP